ncbi:MAG TPA: HEAT repeat domain-containing protein [Candidatus Baltobacterales bacterium]|nr:HEAT repeat domain-containing protein [Candidatus Baltobacterales bacterium]
MSDGVERYREELRQLESWEPYLHKHSGLAGPRANLELVAAVAEEADADRLWRLSASGDEFLALCGTAGLGRIALMEPETVMTWLHELASDPRWRVREGVALALQRFGRENMGRLLAEMRSWANEAPFVQRAAAAALCEPDLLRHPEDTVEVLMILDRITKSLGAATNRKDEGFQALRKALGYCWSVAAAASPSNARPYIEKWLQSTDKDIAWVMKSNLGKARMAGFAGDAETPARHVTRSRKASGAKAKPRSAAEGHAPRSAS